MKLENQLCRNLLLKKLSGLRDGRIDWVESYHGVDQTLSFGNDRSDLTAKIRILHPRAYPRMVLGGSIGAGESYMAQDWESSDLTSLIRIFARNRHLTQELDSGLAALTAPLQRLFHRLRKNSIEGSKKNIQAHYDLGNDFFELFLDSNWMYSSAFFSEAEMTLEKAQTEKLDRICRKLKLTPQDHLLEIGTGWGGFALHAAQNYGCRITTTTISQKQYELARKRIEEAGLSERITVLFQDYRLLSGQFDKLVSIEMIEAVGLEFLETYFQKCNSLLKPGGQMLLQAITIRDQFYENAKRNVDFIQRYIFPGSGIPSLSAMNRATERVTQFQIIHQEDFGPDYAKTLQLWHERLNQNKNKIFDRGYPEELHRMWQFYFSYCEGGFLERSIGVSQIHYLKEGVQS